METLLYRCAECRSIIVSEPGRFRRQCQHCREDMFQDLLMYACGALCVVGILYLLLGNI